MEKGGDITKFFVADLKKFDNIVQSLGKYLSLKKTIDMYTVISINLSGQELFQIDIWSGQLKNSGWKFNDNVQSACWKRYEKEGEYEDEFTSAIVNADFSKITYVVSYAHHEPKAINV